MIEFELTDGLSSVCSLMYSFTAIIISVKLYNFIIVYFSIMFTGLKCKRNMIVIKEASMSFIWEMFKFEWKNSV